MRISLSNGGNPAFRLHPQGRALVPRSAEIPVTGASRDRLSALVSSGRLRIAGSAPESLSPHPSSVENDVTKTPVTKTPVTKNSSYEKLLLRKPAPRFHGRPKKETTPSRAHASLPRTEKTGRQISREIKDVKQARGPSATTRSLPKTGLATGSRR